MACKEWKQKNTATVGLLVPQFCLNKTNTTNIDIFSERWTCEESFIEVESHRCSVADVIS